jgi:hypothetical protein
MNSHVTFKMAKALNWRLPVSFGWKKAETEEESEFGSINPAIEQYPAPSITDIMAELPSGATLRKYPAGYDASCASTLVEKDLKFKYFIYDNPADALAYLFVFIKRKRGENIDYAKDVFIDVKTFRIGELSKLLSENDKNTAKDSIVEERKKYSANDVKELLSKKKSP